MFPIVNTTAKPPPIPYISVYQHLPTLMKIPHWLLTKPMREKFGSANSFLRVAQVFAPS